MYFPKAQLPGLGALPDVSIALPNPTLPDASTVGEGERQWCRWFPTDVKNRHGLLISQNAAIIENVLITGDNRFIK